ncbi:MAG: cob(I)yrinic acid a,c-diamide adenosyltransferase, partial [Bacteroides sp.]|nr:cob(I)yrinic acid a,c-diamide adenosyltransferase [Bacteroides sp.]
MEKGYIHLYTGNGKGKTTAAFGLAIRALCSDKSVYIGQFVKSMQYNETKIERLFSKVKIEQLGRGCFISKSPDASDIQCAEDSWIRCCDILFRGAYDVYG